MTEQQRDLDKETEVKTYFCQKCNKFPDKIREVYAWYAERREWKDGCYELIDSDNGDINVECGECQTTCEER